MRLARQVLIESLTLAAAGGVLGLVLAYGLVEMLKLFGPPDLQRLNRAHLDAGVLSFTAAITLLTGLALVLAALGIYGVMSYGVAQRRHEIGVRMALGAQRAAVARLVLGRALKLTVAGLALGLAGAVALGRYLETLLFEISPLDAETLATVTAILLACAIAAALVPTQRATRVDPMEVLRYE